jgi:hypothetical protein
MQSVTLFVASGYSSLDPTGLRFFYIEHKLYRVSLNYIPSAEASCSTVMAVRNVHMNMWSQPLRFPPYCGGGGLSAPETLRAMPAVA